MSAEKRKKAKGLAKAFKKMSHRKKGGTKGTFTAAATKAGYPDTHQMAVRNMPKKF